MKPSTNKINTEKSFLSVKFTEYFTPEPFNAKIWIFLFICKNVRALWRLTSKRFHTVYNYYADIHTPFLFENNDAIIRLNKLIRYVFFIYMYMLYTQEVCFMEISLWLSYSSLYPSIYSLDFQFKNFHKKVIHKQSW